MTICDRCKQPVAKEYTCNVLEDPVAKEYTCDVLDDNELCLDCYNKFILLFKDFVKYMEMTWTIPGVKR